MKSKATRSLTMSLMAILTALVMLLAVACNKTSDETPTAEESTVSGQTEETSSEPEQTEEVEAYFNETGYPICDVPITITLSGSWGNTPDWNDTIFVEQIEERLGIIIDCQPIADDAWNNQFTLMLSSDSLPDMLTRMANVTTNDISDYGSQGYFLALNDYVDQYAPNLLTWMDEFEMLGNYMTSADGNMYMLVSCTDNAINLTPRVYMNKVWLENVGMDAPASIDELYDVLTAFKEQDANGNGDTGDEIPLNFLIDGDAGYFLEAALMAAFDIYDWDWGEVEYLLQADDSGKVYLADTTDNYKAYLKFMSQLYEEELLDNECYIQTYDEFLSKGERIGFTGYWAPFVLAGQEASYDLNFVWCGAFTSEWNDTPTIVKAQSVGSSPLAVVSAKTEYPEAIVRLIDYLYTDEGYYAAKIGYEGITFEFEETPVEGTEQTITSTVGDYPENEYDSSEEYRVEKVIINGAFSSLTARGYEGLAELPVDLLFDDKVVETYGGWAAEMAYYGLRNEDNTVVETFPALIYTEEESEARSTLYTDIQLYLKSSKAQFITGEVDIDEGWENYLSTLENMGLSDALAIEQAAYDRLMGN